MFEKLNITKIISDHIKTLSNYAESKESENKYAISYSDLFLFFGVPVILSLILILVGFKLDNNISNLLVTSLSIFTGLLFNLLLLVYDIMKKPDNSKPNAAVIKELLKQTYTNISFSILIAITAIILLLIYSIYSNLIAFNPNHIVFNIQYIESITTAINCILLFTIYTFIGVFIMHLYMVLKRIYSLFNSEFNHEPQNAS